jgi:hypothetical protein
MTSDPSSTIPAWAASTAVTAGTWSGGLYTAPSFCSKGANVYFCTSAGTTASSGGPTGTGTYISDGTARWNYYGPVRQTPSIEDFPTYTIGTSVSGLANVYSAAIPSGSSVSAISVQVLSGGTGYTVGNTITLTGGTSSSPVVLTVASVTGGAVNSVTVSNAGSYTVLPTQTVSSTGGGGATFVVRWPDPYWCRFRGGYLAGVNSQMIGYTFQPTLNSTPNAIHSSLEFWSDAPKITVRFSTSSSPCNVIVDGTRLSVGGFYSSSSTALYHTLDYTASGGRKERFYRLEFRFQPSVVAVYVDSSSTAWAPSNVDEMTIVAISDSLLSGSNYGPFQPGNTVVQRLAHELGWNNVWDFSQGGTGYINRGTGAGTTTDDFGYRVAEALTLNGGAGPDGWLLMGSTNDCSGSTPTAVAAAQLTLIQAIRAASSAPIIVFGIWPLDDATYTNSISSYETAMASSIATYAASINDPSIVFIPLRNAPAGPIITGTWNNSFNANSTNNVVYISSGDVEHPPDLGTTYLAKVLASMIRTFISTLA